MLWFALLNTDCACEVVGDPSDVELFLTAFNRNEKLVDAISGTSDASQFLVSFPSHKPEFAAQVDDLFRTKSVRAAMVIDLNHIAHELADKSGRPLLSIFPVAESESTIRRLTGNRPSHLRLIDNNR